jgi:glycine/D-amino acid oxidase-like deaminating enzyme
MNRRQFLNQAARAGAAASLTPLAFLTGCAAKRTAVSPNGGYAAPDISFAGACRVPAVRVAEDREIRTIAGLRPYRPSGFVVRAEKLDDTLVIHNYGHGGAGVTLSWGTAKLALDLGGQGHLGPVAVLGCGAVGLATSRLLQESGFSVTVYTQDLPPNTTSNIAGAQWFPYSVSSPGQRTPAFNQQFLSAAEFAYRRYQSMLGSRYGIRWMRNYFLENEGFQEQGYRGKEGPLRSLLPELRDLAPSEHPFSGYKFVRQFDTMLIEPPVYLSAMLADIRLAGAAVKVQSLADRTAIAQLPEKLVFNCTGLGSKALFNDDELTPIKGQLTVLLPQPEVQYAVLHDDLYMFSRTDGILLEAPTRKECGTWSQIWIRSGRSSQSTRVFSRASRPARTALPGDRPLPVYPI